MHGTQHWRDEPNGSLIAAHTQSLREEDSEDHAGPCGGCTWEERDQLGAMEYRLCSDKKVR